MKDIIFIAGAPGIGKSTLARLLQKELKSPCFEFGWIPEFRFKQDKEIDYVEEEGIAFENLILVVKNYLKHGFKNVIVTDLEDKRIVELDKHFSDADYILFTLTLSNQNTLKSRVLQKERSSDYRDWEQALKINKSIISRKLLVHEIRINADDNTKGIFRTVMNHVQ